MTADTRWHNDHRRHTPTRHTRTVTRRQCRQWIFCRHCAGAGCMGMNTTWHGHGYTGCRCINKQKTVRELLNISRRKFWKITSERTDGRLTRNIAKIRNVHNTLIINYLCSADFYTAFNRRAKRPVSGSEIGHSTRRNRPNHALKQTLPHPDIGNFANRRTGNRFTVRAKRCFRMPYCDLSSPGNEKTEC